MKNPISVCPSSRSAAAIVTVPEVEIVLGVAEDVLQLRFVHLPDGLGGHAHDEPACRYHLALRYQRPRPDLRAFLHHGAGEDDCPDADADVIHDGAGVNDAAMPDGDVGSHDAWEFRRDVEDRVVLDVGVAAKGDVVVLVSAEHGERPHARSLLDGDVADDLSGRINPRAGMHARGPTGDAPDHGRAYFPVQRGGRFSRKALMPSRKSALA